MERGAYRVIFFNHFLGIVLIQRFAVNMEFAVSVGSVVVQHQAMGRATSR